jgi:hypothetical protein
VVVGAHEAVRDGAPGESRDRLAEELQELESVLVVDVDVRAMDAVRRYVEEAVRQIRTEHARHATTVRQ